MTGTTIASARSPRGEVVLRRRDWDGELELRVNGVFVMDSQETATERALATLALDSIARSTNRTAGEAQPLTVLAGGLGLGYTLAQLAGDPKVGRVIVAEIEPALVEWHLAGLVPVTKPIIGSSRVRIDPRDVQTVLREQAAHSLDAVVLDVDNGPGYLVYADNASIYQRAFLESCRARLAERGVLVVWSADRAPQLADALTGVFDSVSHHAMAVTRQQRVDHYHAYVAPGHPADGTEGEPPEQPPEQPPEHGTEDAQHHARDHRDESSCRDH